MYRETLLILALILAVAGGLVDYFVGGIIGVVGHWVMVIGIIVFFIWLILYIVNAIKSGT